MSDFKVGDIVQLKTGGPAMTITYIDEDSGEVTCKWFIFASSSYGKENFYPGALKIAEPD
jgi:uncharacterized protein YodC (DUF2158 family)